MANTPRFKFRTLVLASLATVAAVLPIATAAQACARLADWIMQPAPKGAVLGANTLTGLIPTLYEAMNVVSREMVGFIPAVTRDSRADRAALNQTVRVPIGESGALENITPGATPADSGDTTVTYADVVITNSKAAPVRWNGEEELAVGSTGTYNRVLADQFADGMRKLVNAMEADLAITAKRTASRAYGTAGTTPFGTAGDMSDLAQLAKILDDNGCPVTDRQIVLNSSAIANLRGKQSVLFKVNEAGSSDMLRTGMTDLLQNFAVRYSGGIGLHTKGTGASYLLNLGSPAIGTTTIPADTGSGTILAGDVATFAGTTDKYVVNTALSGGSFTIGAPGLVAAETDNDAITVGNNYTPNFGFRRSSLVLACRAPAVPTGGDSADDAMMLTDPVTGLSFEVRMYRQYRQVKFEICMAWGTAGIKSAHNAILLG